MRVVTLSDHAGDQLRQAQDARASADEARLQQWQSALDARQERIDGLADSARQAWSARRPLAALGGYIRLVLARLSPKPRRPAAMVTSAAEGRFQGGVEGEERVTARLSQIFDDRWVAFRGYFNRAGETDLLLLGPTAIVALEVKYLNGEVHCEGNAWTRDKSDKYGNVVERGLPVRDARGRSPGQQVNATADALQAQLARRGHPLSVRRAVILAHDASRMGRMREPGVDFVGVLVGRKFEDEFAGLVRGAQGAEELPVPALEEVIRADHEHHTRRKAEREQQKTQPSSGPPHSRRSSGRPQGPRAPLVRVRPSRTRKLPLLDTGPVTELEVRQAQAIFKDLRALVDSGGDDERLENGVRQAVYGQLNNNGRYRVLSMVTSIRDKPERALLMRLIKECRQTVELPDRWLHAVVLPVAIRWVQPDGTDWSGLQLQPLDEISLNTMGHHLQVALAVDQVVVSKYLYSYSELQPVDIRGLWQLMKDLAHGQEPSVEPIEPVSVVPTPTADWQVVYMLAVAITEPQDWLAPDEESRRLLAEHLDLLGNLVSSPATMMCRQLGACEAVVEGVWGLAEGLEVGRDLEIRHALEQMLVRAVRRLDASAPVLYGSYAHDPESSGVRVLVQHAHRPEEHHYPDYSTGEGLAGFRKILDAAVAARVPAGTSVNLEELDAHDYRIKARASGLSWVGQDPMGDEDAGEDANTRPD